jgi:hypothetical protein
MFAKGRRRRTVEIFEVDDTATNVNEHTDRERGIYLCRMKEEPLLNIDRYITQNKRNDDDEVGEFVLSAIIPQTRNHHRAQQCIYAHHVYSIKIIHF